MATSCGSQRLSAGVGRVADDFNLIAAQHVVFKSALRPSERLILLAILDCWSRKYPKPYPGIAELIRKTGLARQTVIDGVESLVVTGIVPEPGKLDENGRRRSGCRFVYDIEKAVHNLDRSNVMRSATPATADRYTNQTGQKQDRSSSARKPVYPAAESSSEKAANRPKEPPEGTTAEDAGPLPESEGPTGPSLAAAADSRRHHGAAAISVLAFDGVVELNTGGRRR
jgi:hypothetical protein